MKQLPVGVVGVGHLGYHHARLYAALPDAELVGIVDADLARAEAVAAEFSTRAFPDTASLIAAGVQAVSVATPTSSHHEVAATLLDHGVHTLVEKPIASTVEEASDLVARAGRQQCTLQVGHVERFNGAVLTLFEALETPQFIECHRLSPFPMRGTDVSVVHDLMIHDLDIVLTLDKSPIVSLDAVGVPVFSATEDIANVRLRFASGCVANITSSRVSLERMRKIRIFAENAYVSTDYSAQEVVVYRKQSGPLPADANPMEHISIEQIEVKKEEPLKLELQAFLKAVRESSPPVVSGEDGLRALQVVQDIVAFIRSHGPATGRT